MWQPLFNGTLTSQWQLSAPITAKNFRLTHAFNQKASRYQPIALIALGRVNENGKLEIFSPQRIIPREESEIIQFSLLPFQWQYSIAIKLLVAPDNLSTQWSLQVDMPIYSTLFTPDLSEGCDTFYRDSAQITGSNYTKVLEANTTRRKFRVSNLGAQPIYIGIQPEFAPGDCLTVIPPHGIYSDDIGWKGEVYANLFGNAEANESVIVWEYGLTGEYAVPASLVTENNAT